MGSRDALSRGSSFPAHVGRYELILPIASGGMATVYLGRTRWVDGAERRVAVKLVHAHLREEGFGEELVEEAKLASRIHHTNVVPVLDAGDEPEGVYLVMDYVHGDSLHGLLNKEGIDGGVDPAVSLRILCDALSGLHAAHELRDERGAPISVVHRDVTPHNVLVGLDGVARLADFGVARARTRRSHTRTGMVKGKLGYMPPEQAKGIAVDRRVDVWAAGVIAWEIFAQRRLYESLDDPTVLLAIVTEEPPPLRTIDPSIAPAIEAVVRSALTADPTRRCPNAAVLREELLDAIASSGLRLASTEEVGKAVERVAGARLADRERRATEVLCARAADPETPDGVDPSPRWSAEQSADLMMDTSGTVPARSTARRRFTQGQFAAVGAVAAIVGATVAIASLPAAPSTAVRAKVGIAAAVDHQPSAIRPSVTPDDLEPAFVVGTAAPVAPSASAGRLHAPKGRPTHATKEPKSPTSPAKTSSPSVPGDPQQPALPFSNPYGKTP